jgi:hypothetical protein
MENQFSPIRAHFKGAINNEGTDNEGTMKSSPKEKTDLNQTRSPHSIFRPRPTNAIHVHHPSSSGSSFGSSSCGIDMKQTESGKDDEIVGIGGLDASSVPSRLLLRLGILVLHILLGSRFG